MIFSHHLPAPRLCGGECAPPGTATGQSGRLDASLLATRVLIVEDEAMIAWTMESLLEDLGFTDIVIVATGEDAIAQNRAFRPGLILSDINLGRDCMDGVEAVAAIRRESDVSIVFITGYAGPEARDRIGRDIPGAHLLRKPVVVDELRRAIIETLDRQRPH